MHLPIFRSNWPFAPHRLPFFYGWFILFCATAGTLMSVPGQTMGVSVFTDDLMVATLLDRVDLSLAYLAGTLISALLLTHTGKLYDRLGARRMVVFVAPALGLTLGYASQIDRVISLTTAPLPTLRPYIAFGTMSLGFFGLRFLGQGTITLISRNMAMKWFEQHRGLANGIMGVATAMGFSIAPLVLNLLIEELTWRGAWQCMALTIGILFSLFALIFFRDNPQECGLHPDNRPVQEATRTNSTATCSADFTLAQARSTYTFWIFTLCTCIASLYVTALTFHLTSVFARAGYDRAIAVGIFLPASVIAIGLNFVGSWLSDQIHLKYHLIFFNLGLVCSIAGLLLLETGWGLGLIILGKGTTNGLFAVLGNIAWPRFFGLRHLGAIGGFAMTWNVLFSAIGPAIFGFSEEQTGSYDTAAWICMALLMPLFVGAFFAGTPRRG